MLTFGSICENLSSTPETPKSGEVELQTAPEGDDDDDYDDRTVITKKKVNSPKAAVATIAMIASGQFGM